MFLTLVLHLLLLTRSNYANEGVNFAQSKSTWQSSTTADGVSARAVDGYKNPDYAQNSCMQTLRQYEPWWAVDLGQELFVTSVQITNRADCCWEDLANFRVLVGANLTNGGKLNSQCGPTYKYNTGAGQTLTVSCAPPLLGQYVSVNIVGAGGALNFCELEVYGFQRHNVFSVKAISYGAQNFALGKLSQVIVDDTYDEKFVNNGHYIISFDMTTGEKIEKKHFNTQQDSMALIEMPSYLQNLSSEIFVFVIMHDLGSKYYHTSIPTLQTLSGNSHISDQLAWGDSWSLLGYKGILPSPSWRKSMMKNVGHGPAVVEEVIPKLLVPPAPPSSIVIVDLTSSSFTLTWSRPPGIVAEHELPLTYIVCVSESGNGSLVNGSLVKNCTNIGDAHLFTNTGLDPQTEYNVSVKAQSYAGFGREAVVHVTTMEKADSYEIHVELVSRIKEDVLYRIGAQSYSSITIRGQQQNFDQHGHHFIVLDPKTGSQVMQGSFDTYHDPDSGTKMTQFLSTVPKPSIILMVVYYQAHDYYAYASSFLLSVCPRALSSYSTRESWSMICLNGFGTMRWVTSHTSSGDKGPAVVNTNLLLPKELKHAPELNNVVSRSSRSLELHWTPPITDDYTGDVSSYQICYQESSITTDAGCSLLTAGSNLSQAVIDGLHPFQEYRVKILAVAPLGYGPYSNVSLSTTLEAEPSSGPTSIKFPQVNSSSILITWSLPPEDERNGIIRQYSVCYRSEDDPDPCDNVTVAAMNETWYEVSGFKPYRKIKFEIRAATDVGFGPAAIAYQTTSQTAPGGPPNQARTTHVGTTSVALSWLPPDPELHNGRIINYTICIRVYSLSPGPCIQEVSLGNQTNYTAINLKPYTMYLFKISAGTEVGFGPPALAVDTTLQTEPSGPPTDLQVTYFTRNHMDITWSPPDPSEVNGVLTKYSVCIRNQSSSSSDSCLHGDTVPYTQVTYTFSGLKPYVIYSIEVQAATVKGFGPAALLSQRTAEAEPTGPPTKRTVRFVNQSTITFSWSAPELELQNGVIIHYSVCIREYGPEFSCVRSTQVTESSDNVYTYSGLSPIKEYIVVIKAATVIGLGPPSFIQKTAGECDLPVLQRGGSISDDSFSASGFLTRNYEPYQARIDGDLPWCDSGTRNNAYVQVDFRGSLRILGVATKGHKQHWQSWVSTYKVLYSLDSMEWNYVNVSGETVISGNTGDGGEILYFLDEPVLARFVRFQVDTFMGLHPCMGIQVYGCAPTIKPATAFAIHRKPESIKVSWNPVSSESKNGKIFGYKVCSKLSSSLLPCEISGYVDYNTTLYTVNDLIPYTAYDIEISAGTVAGYGPPVVIKTSTDQSRPSGPPRFIMVQDVTATSLTLLWSPPEESKRNGVITKYGICCGESSILKSCKHIIYVAGESYVFTEADGLRPNTEYMLRVIAATRMGWGPGGIVYETTLPAAPSGPPTSVSVTRIGSRILQIFWQAPEAKKQNGDIIGYRLCVKEKRASTPCRNYVTLAGTQLMHTVDELKPYTVYNTHVEAKTALGYGPAQDVDYRTGEAAPSAPPKDVAIRAVSSSSIEIIWSAPDQEKQNGVIAMYEVEVYQEMSGSIVEKVTSSLMRANTTLWKVSDLSPRTDYIFHIKAGTAEGFGPAVIIHKRSDGGIAQTAKISTGKLTAGGIAGGSIMLVVLVAGCVLSILWNKGLLPHTRARKLKLESERRQRHKQRRQRKKKRKRRKEMSEQEAAGAEINATDSVYSELNDYDAPNEPIATVENLYGTGGGDIYPTGIFAPVTNVVSQDIYGTAPFPPREDLYGTAPPGMEIFRTAPPQDIHGNALLPGGNINVIQKSNTILPQIVPRPSVIPPIIPLEATLSSVFVKMSSTRLNDPNSASRPTSPIPPQDSRSTTPTFVIPQPSKFTPVISSTKVTPKIDTAASKTHNTGSDFSAGPTFPQVTMENVHNYPIPHPSINTFPTPDTLIESFRTPSVTAASRADVAGSDFSTVPIHRHDTTQNVPNYPHPSINVSPISDTPNPRTRAPSIHHHPNAPRYSIDYSLPLSPSSQPQAWDSHTGYPQHIPAYPQHIPAYPQLIPGPIPHQESMPIPNKRKSA